MARNNITIHQVDALLPQTQCGLCDYAGCKPYAEAIVFDNERLDKCPPGGMKTLKKLGDLAGENIEPYLSEMAAKAKPRLVAIIREDECIGCKKCIMACPVDAILGGAKMMHTVIQNECTGCELCVEPCPMDCIDIVATTELSDQDQLEFSNTSRKRFQNRENRLERIKLEKTNKHLQAKKIARKNDIAEAVARAKAKKGKTQ